MQKKLKILQKQAKMQKILQKMQVPAKTKYYHSSEKNITGSVTAATDFFHLWVTVGP